MDNNDVGKAVRLSLFAGGGLKFLHSENEGEFERK